MNEGGAFEPEFPSEEELEALLSESGGGDGEGLDPRRPILRALVVSRDDATLKTLTEVLAGLRIEISMARNPFTALDYLRARDFDWIITDFSLWAASGKLLFDRIAGQDRAVEVIFVCGSQTDGDELRRARLTPARAVLSRPLETDEVRSLLERLRRETLDQRAPAGTSAPPPAPAEPDPSPAADRGSSREQPPERREDSGPDAAPSPRRSSAFTPGDRPDPTPEEIEATRSTWYAFFFRIRREARRLEDRRPGRVLEMLARHLSLFDGLAQVALVFRRSVTPDPVSHFEVLRVRVPHAGGPGERHEQLVEEGVVLEVLAELSFSFSQWIADDLEGSPGDPSESPYLRSHWVQAFTTGERRALFIGVPHRGVALPPLPEEIRDELPQFLEELLGSPRLPADD